MDHYLKQELYKLIIKDSQIFDFIQNGSLDGIWYWDLENPKNEWMSEKFWTELGYDPNEMPHKASAWQGIINQEDLKIAIDNFNKHCENPNHPYDQLVRYTHKNGSTVYIQCRGIAIRDENGKPVRMLGAHTNVTSLKEMEEQHKNHKELLQKLTQQIPGVIYQYRYHPDGRNYFPYSSEKIWNVYEVTPEQVKEDASIVLSRIHPDDYQQVMDSIMKSYETLDLWEDKYRVILPQKGIRWLYGQAQPERLEDDSVLWHGYIQDITEKRMAEIAFSDSEKRWKFALEGAKDGVWDWNLETNEVYFSHQWKAMLGFEEHEIEGSLDEWSKRVHPDDLQKCYNDIQEYLDGEVEVYSNVHRVICKDESYKWILDRGKIVEKDINGKALRMVGTHTDLTERIEIEHRLNEKNKELEQFTYITSHDLQEPLNSIISFLDLLEESKDKLDDFGKKSIEVISRSAYRMKDFIISLLEFSRIGKQKQKTEVDIIGLIGNLKIDLHDLTQKTEANIEYIGKPLKIIAFEPDLTKLFQNLIINGIKYTSTDTKPVIIINSEETSESYKFSISDNGIGIEKEHFEKIFEVFQRLHSRDKYSGTGIGLSHCKKVVELHNGKIWLDSEINKGTTFYFTISK